MQNETGSHKGVSRTYRIAKVHRRQGREKAGRVDKSPGFLSAVAATEIRSQEYV